MASDKLRRRVAGTMRSADDAERRRRRDSALATGQMTFCRSLGAVASPGFGVRGARRSTRRRREHRGAEWGGVRRGVSAPQPTMGSGGAS